MTWLLLIGMFLTQATADSRPKTGVAMGIVRGPDGKPASGVRVAAMVAASGSELTVPVLQGIVRSDENGSYRLEGILPGRYFIVAGRIDTPTYYPGTTSMARATEVSIVPGATISALDFLVASESTRPDPAATAFVLGQLVPPPPVAASVSGKVTVEGGVLPSSGSRGIVTARRLGDDYAIFAEIQENGSFRLQLAEGDHLISISRPNGYALKTIVSGGADLESQPLRVGNRGTSPAPAEIHIALVRLPRVTIRGRVLQETTGKALSDGEVKLSGSGVSVRTALGPDGSFEIPEVFSGVYVLDIVAFGHARILRTLEVVDQNLTLELVTQRLY